MTCDVIKAKIEIASTIILDFCIVTYMNYIADISVLLIEKAVTVIGT